MDFPSDQEIIDMYESGISANKIAKKYNSYCDKITKILRKNGIALLHESDSPIIKRELMVSPKGHAPYNKKGEGGRPKIYTEEFINNEADALEEWMKDKNNIFIEDFCFERGYHDTRIPEFCKVNERFSHTYNLFSMKQKSSLFNGGLKKKFAHPMCALILSHNHNIHQKTEQKLTGDVTNPLHFIIQNSDGTSKDLIDESE